MPFSAPRPCRFPGCPALVREGAHCDEHRGTVVQHHKRRPSPNGLGYTRAWAKLRAYVLNQQPLCEWPGCKRPAVQVDHVIPLTRGGTNDPSNLQALCASHHSQKTATLDGGFGRKRRD